MYHLFNVIFRIPTYNFLNFLKLLASAFHLRLCLHSAHCLHFTSVTSLSRINFAVLEHVYMRLEVNSNRFEMSFRLHGNLHGDFTAATFQTMARF